MNDSTYRFIATCIRLFIWQGWRTRARLQGAENLPAGGPAVFIGNHANSLGPIGCVSMLPFRLYPWMRPEMLDRRTNPEYMRGDFIEKDLGLRPPFSRWVSQGLARLVVPLLTGIGSIPAFQSDQVMKKRITLAQSLDALYRGRSLLVFPEVLELALDPRTRMRPFSRGVLWLAVLFHRKMDTRLPIYPVCTHPSHRIRLGPVVLLDEDQIATPSGNRPGSKGWKGASAPCTWRWIKGRDARARCRNKPAAAMIPNRNRTRTASPIREAGCFYKIR